MSELSESYENGECPDCGEKIEEDMVDGDNCLNCGHVFYTLTSPPAKMDKE